ncbi:MAG: T9SS type A sorting domain-containing protein [bacterium]
MKKILILVFVLSVFGTGNIYSQQWEKLNNGLYGGSITKIVIKDSMFVAADYGRGIFISMDYGKNWREANTGLDKNVLSVAINDSVIFAGTYNGLYTSTNNGVDWNKVSNITDQIKCITTQGSNVFLGTYKTGIIVSTDYGHNWEIKNNVIKSKTTNCIALLGNKVYAGTNGGLYYSTDLGNNWKTVSNDNFWNNNLSYGVSSIALTDSFIYIIIGYRTYISRDNCATWKKITNADGGDWIKAIGNTLYFKTHNDGIVKSNDEAQSWTDANGNLPNKKINDLASAGNELCAVLDGKGVFISKDNGGSWSPINNGLTDIELGNIINIKGTLYVSQSGFSSYQSTNNGNSWSETNNGLTGVFGSLCEHNSNLFIGTSTGLFISKDKGLSWQQMQLDKIYPPIYGLASNENKLYLIHKLFSGRVNLSIDEGKTWNDISETQPLTQLGSIFSIREKIFISGRATNDSEQNGVFLTTDDGKIWKKVLPDCMFDFAAIDTTIFVAGDKGIYYSNDYGGTWVLSKLGRDNPFCRGIEILGHNIFIGTLYGVFLSKDFGKTWIDLNYNLEHIDVGRPIVKDGYLYVVTGSGSSVYRLDISALSVNEGLQPGDISISPNPSSDFITINFKPSVGSAIQIYNTLGEIVFSVGTGRDLSAKINISALPKGMYFVRIGGETAKFIKN